MPQTINLKVTKVNESHVHCSLFLNGALTGELVFNIGEYQIFGAVLSIGIKTIGSTHVINNSDERVFIEWTKEGN